MFSLGMLTAYLVPVIVVIVILKLIALPFKILFKLIINMIIGGIILFALTTLGIISITITWWMAALVGILGIPGAVAVVILSFIL